MSIFISVPTQRPPCSLLSLITNPQRLVILCTSALWLWLDNEVVQKAHSDEQKQGEAVVESHEICSEFQWNTNYLCVSKSMWLPSSVK